MDYQAVIHSVIDPIVEHKESVLIREIPGEDEKNITIFIASEKDDISRLIGRKGIIASAIREVLSVAGKTENKHVHIKFESFDEGDKEGE